MKKIFCFILVMFVVLFFSGCEGDVTRALRHDGFNIGGEFSCDAFFSGDEYAESIRYLTGAQIITSSGRIYEISMSQKYSNGTNCKVADTDLKVVAVYDNKVFKAEDGNIYTLVADSNNSPYTQITSADNSFAIYQLLLQPEGTIKAVTADSSNGIYYVLKSDGNVYAYTISSQDRNAGPVIVGTSIVYNRDDYGGNIIDFNYNGDSAATFVRTDYKVFRMKNTNSSECSKYADIKCEYQMMESTVFQDYSDYILAYNGSTLITTYKKIFTAQ